MSAKDEAFKLWKKKVKYKDIAAQVGVSESCIKSWASREWNASKKKSSKSQKKVATDTKDKSQPSTKSKRGAPKGNRNAVGNKGGAPEGNSNALKHGGYSALFDESVFSENEHKYFSSEDEMIDEEKEVIQLIKSYHIREYRLLKAINQYIDQDKPIMDNQIRFEDKRYFKDKEEEKLYNKIVSEKVDKRERLPGEKYSIQITTEPNHKRIARLEQELTRVQRAKREAIALLLEIRVKKKGSAKNAIADSWIEAMADLESGNVGEFDEQ